MKLKLDNFEYIELELEGNSNVVTVQNYNGLPLVSDLTTGKVTKVKK